MADIILNITVPITLALKALEALKALAGTHINIEARGSSPNPEDEFNGRWDLSINPKTAEETDKQFGERFLREMGKAVIKMYYLALDNKRYRAEVSVITPPTQDVPDNILS